MSEAIVQRPSYRVEREGVALPWRMLGIAAALLGVAAVGAGGWWVYQSLGRTASVPVVEADPRPFKVRPDDPGGLRVPNQTELILERPAQRAQASQAARPASVAPGAEAPDLGGLRAAATPRQAPAPAAAPAPQPAPQPAPAAAAPTAAPATAAATGTPPGTAPGAARPAGRVQVQLGALPTEEAARAEWDRLARRAPELFQGRSPQIARLDRGEGQTPLFRLRTGGLADQEAAAAFCEQVRARGGACVPLRS